MGTCRVDGGPSLAPQTTEGAVVAWFGGESVASSSSAANDDDRGDGTGGGGGGSSSRKRRRRRAGGGGGGVPAGASAAACCGIHLTGAAGGPVVVGVAAGTGREEPDAGLLLTAVRCAARAPALACEAFAVLAALCDHARDERDGGGGACATAAAVVREMVGSVAVPLLDALGDDARAWTREGGDDDAAHARHTAARRATAGYFRTGAAVTAATALLGASSAALARAGATRERWRDAAWDVLDRLPPDVARPVGSSSRADERTLSSTGGGCAGGRGARCRGESREARGGRKEWGHVGRGRGRGTGGEETSPSADETRSRSPCPLPRPDLAAPIARRGGAGHQPLPRPSGGPSWCRSQAAAAFHHGCE